jgi:pyridoxine/pyridoxamine 5'-phosphate oxidase
VDTNCPRVVILQELSSDGFVLYAQKMSEQVHTFSE